MPISTINTNSIADDAVTVPKVTDQVLAHRNLIINGAMQVAQRGTSVTGITSTPGYVTVDRFILSTVIGTLTAEQSTDAPNGFSNSFKVSCTAAESTGSLGSGDYMQIQQRIEGQNLQQLAYGTANAKSMTLSFWVKSNKTGAATIELQQKDNSDRQVTPSYTINSANTWEYKTISIPADTSGLINNDNGTGMWVLFWLQSGSAFTGGTNQTSWTTESNPDRNASNLEFATSTSDYFAVTGVQLEVGDTATPFEHRSYGDELARCQRYYVESNWVGTQVVDANNTDRNLIPSPPQPMRGNPTITVFNPSTGTANQGYCFSSGATATISYIGGFSSLNTFQIGTGAYLQSNNTNRYTSFRIKMDAEL